MALGSILGSVAAGAGSALAGQAASSLFGGDERPTRNLRPTSINLNRAVSQLRPISVGGGAAARRLGSTDLSALSRSPLGFAGGGLQSSINENTLNLTAGEGRQGLIGNLAGTFPEQAGLLAELRGRVAPGMSELRESRLQQIENARRRSVGNLRENLARRRVLGSSFGQDALARAEAEFAQQADQAAAESFLQELDLTNQLINQEFEARRGEFQTGLDELNLQAELASDLSARASTELNQNARLKAQLDAELARSQAELLSRLGITEAELNAQQARDRAELLARGELSEAEINAQLARERAGLLAEEQQGTGRFIGQTLQPSLDELRRGISGGVSNLFNRGTTSGALGPNTFAQIGSVLR